MAEKKFPHYFPVGTIVELVAIASDGKVYKKQMTYGEAKEVFTRKKKGFTYYIYEIGFSQYN